MSATCHERMVETAAGALFARRWDASGAHGNRTPIVLLHDSLGCVALWRDFPARLAVATSRSVVAYDRPGFGRSAPRTGALPPDFIRREARTSFAAVCDAFGLGDFVAFGHSVGGGMAVGCTAAYPDRCRALVTESAQAFVEDRTVAGIREAKRRFADEAQRDRLRRYHGDKAAWALSAWTDTWLAPAFAGWSLDADLPRVRCPVLVLHGECDEYGSMRHPERIARLVRGPATRHVLPGCGHVPHRERADLVLDLVARWFDRIAA